jgi:hypothetical protein
MMLTKFCRPSPLALTLVTGALLGGLGACASKNKQPERVNMKPKGWDYATIRKGREAEAVQTPPPAAAADEAAAEANCTIMTHAQMARAKAAGCRKMDPREGAGADAYCCPKE